MEFIYIAGPMRGKDDWNREAFARASERPVPVLWPLLSFPNLLVH